MNVKVKGAILPTMLLLLAGCSGPLPNEENGLRPLFPERTNDRAKPVVMVHGYDFWGEESADSAAWLPLKSLLQRQGWPETIAWGYYGCDVGFDDHADLHGDHAAHLGAGAHHATPCTPVGHTRETPIEHIAYHWAWAMNDRYANDFRCFDAVAHSMGGLVLRYAIGQVQAGNPEFPPHLCVEDVVTLGTPHQGSTLAGFIDLFCPSVQCDELKPNSPFLNGLPENPQGYGGTDWTLVASEADLVVDPSSAFGMAAAHRVLYFAASQVSHALSPNYLADFGAIASANVGYQDAGQSWRVTTAAVWPIAWVDQSLVHIDTAWSSGTEPPTPVTTPISPQSPGGGTAPGREVHFEASCSDPNGDLSGSSWDSRVAGGAWQRISTDSVQLRANPWMTWEDLHFPVAGAYEVRVTCVTKWWATSEAVWAIRVDPSYNAVPTAQRVDPSSEYVQGSVGVTYSFRAACADAERDLVQAEWYSGAGGSWSLTKTDTVQMHDDPWYTSQSYTFSSAGTAQVKVRCVDGATSSEATWTVTISQATSSPPTSSGGATRVAPTQASGSVPRGSTVDFEASCEDAASDLSHAEWATRSSSGSWVLDYTDNVNWHANPWYTDRSYSFTQAGTYGIRLTCVKETGSTSSVDWTITAT